ncbi:MAG: hypothetical protein PHW93_03330 [Candidatus Methanomethylophilaceae archaeon]|nr:hypothetical protein [Candidatus Methanomethylophilaceae archaeon]
MMGDFSLKNGSFGKGIVGMLAAALLFMIIPVSIATLGIHVLELAMEDIASSSDLPLDADSLGALINELVLFRDKVILYSLPIIILAFPKGFYPKGNFGRVPFGILQSVAIALWIWYVANGGVLPIDLDIPLDDFVSGINATATVSLDLILTGFIYLFMLVAIAKGGYYFVEYGGNRKKYLLAKMEKDSGDDEDDDEPEPEKKSRRKRSKEKEEDDDWEMV